ncbi:putative membrane fusogenic activity protein [Candidatus Cyrtobacter comes]|uniref:Membrane fusogenic activity protein n=2 Tax=Candidatus Cyrtobacter comes TaxID=675776 RepID=A0ABU5L8K9_9RICK|nr:putative membrane fusogenic activity protein [Candidatus Cyrtobacter comes]
MGKDIFDSISKFTNSSISTISEMWKDLGVFVKNQVESTIKGMNFITRSEFEALKKLVIQNKIEIEKIKGKSVKESDIELELRKMADFFEAKGREDNKSSGKDINDNNTSQDIK